MKCLICGRSEDLGCVVCKVCSMHTDKPLTHESFFFCSEKCVEFFRNIKNKSPELAEREIIF